MTEPTESRFPFTGLHATIWMSFAFFLMLLGALLLSLVRQQALTDLVSLGILSGATFLLSAALLITFHPAGDTLGAALGLRSTHAALLPLGLLGGIAAQVPAEGLLSLVYRFYPAAEGQAEARLSMMQADGPLRAWALGLVLSFLVPFAEEVFFRGAVFGALRRTGTGPVRAIVYTGIGFTLSHFDLAMVLPIGLVAAFLGLLRSISGSLWPSILAHIGFNGITMVFALTSADVDDAWVLSPSTQLGGAAALLAVTWVSLQLAGGAPAAAVGRSCDEGRRDE